MDSITRNLGHYMHPHVDIIRPPPLATTFVACLSIAFTVSYVLPLYLFPTSRPSPTILRDSPSVIQARVRIVSISCTFCTLATIYIISWDALRSRAEVFHLLGYYPVKPEDVWKPVFLTMMLFLGPLFERLLVEGEWKRYLTGQPIREIIDSWIGWRNYIAGPITEEVMFRSLLISLSTLTIHTPKQIIFLTPLYFGLAHVHHFYEFCLTHPRVSLTGAFLTSLFQFFYTTVFGWYASFVFLRTGNIYAVIIIHSFCNWMGFPRLWGRVESGSYHDLETSQSNSTKGPAYKAPYREPHLSIVWTIAYYVLLLLGLAMFTSNLWSLTASKNKIMVV